MVSGAARIVALLVALGGCGHATPRKERERRMDAASDEQAWHAAEATARAHYRRKGWDVTDVSRVESLPFLLRVGFSDGILDTLVFDGKVVAEKTGLSGLGAYLRASKFLERRVADAEAFVRLLYYFDAFPKTTAQGGLYDLPEKPALLPKLSWRDDGAELVVHYVTSPASPPGFGGSRANADVMTVEQWTLKIPRDYALAWTRRMIDVPR
jgi:hypothetical protein